MMRILPLATVLALLLGGCGEPAAPVPPAANAAPAVAPASAPVPAPAEAAAARDDDAAARVKLGDAEMRAAHLRSEAVREAPVAARIVLTATVQANQERLAHVLPRVPGRIVAIAARLGERVKAGQTLARLDSIELGEAHSAWLQAESQNRLAEADFARTEKLYAEQVLAQKDYLRSRAEAEKARAGLRAAADRLRLLGGVPAATANSIFALTAPFAGTVIGKTAVLGELAPADRALFVVADLSTVWIEADLFEKDLGRVKLGAPASVSVAAYPDTQFEGRLSYLSSVMDKASRTVKARIEVPNPDGRLKPEMFASVAVEAGPAAPALTVPTAALTLLEGRQVVFVQEQEGFVARPVVVGEQLGGRVVVKDGLAPGEAVVVEGAYALKSRLLKSRVGDHD